LQNLLFLILSGQIIEVLVRMKQLVYRVAVGMIDYFVTCIQNNTVLVRIGFYQASDYCKGGFQTEPLQELAHLGEAFGILWTVHIEREADAASYPGISRSYFSLGAVKLTGEKPAAKSVNNRRGKKSLPTAGCGHQFASP